VSPISFPITGLNASFIVSEANGYRSREALVVASGSGKLPAGTVMGRLTASGKLTPYTPGASDGSQVFAAITYEAIDATAADVKVTGMVRDCEVQRAALSFAGTPTDSQKAAAYTSMAAVGIALR
jgi:hypothetical protein